MLADTRPRVKGTNYADSYHVAQSALCDLWERIVRNDVDVVRLCGRCQLLVFPPGSDYSTFSAPSPACSAVGFLSRPMCGRWARRFVIQFAAAVSAATRCASLRG